MTLRSTALLALCLAVVVGCSQSKTGSDETHTAAVSVTIGLSASEVGAATVEFFVSHPTALPQRITGSVPVADPVTSFTLTQLPVVALGDPYTLFLVARKTDDTWVCEGGTTFEHDQEGVATSVSLTLTCPTSDTLPNGEVGVDITFQLNLCPVIEEISAAPQITVLSDPVTLQSLASDPDNTAPVTYLWTATGGLIADATAATTTFTCPTIGDYDVTLTVSDSDTHCDQQRQLQISCTPDALCGNGIREVTEFCDDGANDGGELECLNCTEFQICLDGRVAGTEQCDDSGWSAACDADCTTAVCGDALHNPASGEVCDEGLDTSACDADCTAAFCGDGTLNIAAGESCDTGGQSLTCNADCTFAGCGDGTINVAAGEQCDDAGQTATCDADCTAARCGDGTVNTTAGEACDDAGESATCDVDCSAVVCGDALTNTTAGEICDDGTARLLSVGTARSTSPRGSSAMRPGRARAATPTARMRVAATPR
jgi:hypothetical protein